MPLRYLAVLLFVSAACPGLAQPKAARPARVRVAPPLTHVTVYVNGTMLEHQAQVKLAAGLNQVVVTELGRGLDTDKLEARLTDGVELLAVDDNDSDYAEEDSTQAATALRPGAADSLRRFEAEQRTLANELAGLRQEAYFLLANQTVPAGTGSRWSEEVQRGADLMRRRLPAIRQDTLRLTARLAELKKLREQTEANGRTQPASGTDAPGAHVLLVQAPQAGTALLTLRYFIPSGRALTWRPALDIRANAAGDQVQFLTHGLLTNRSGLDWKRVPVTLLRYPVSDELRRPELEPWELDFEGNGSSGEGRVDAFVVKGDSKGQPAVQQSYRYELPEPLTLASQQRHELSLPPVTLPARAEYLAVPRSSDQVVLQTKVSGWQGLQLAKTARLYHAGMYVGSTELDTEAYNDSLAVALGTDPQLLVGRAKLEDFSANVPGTTKRRVRLTYELNVRNRHPEAVRLRLLDEVPISEEKEIEVKVLEASGAERDVRTGRLTWLLTLPPGVSKRLRFSFQVDYPRGRKVEIINHRVRISNPKFR